MSIHLPIHATASVARFDLISPPLWQFLKAFYSILQNFEPTSAIILCYWDFVIVFNGKILKNYLAIWSHWSRFRFQMSKIAKIYGNQSQWKEAVKSWEQAIQSAKQVGQDTSYFNEAKPLIDNYTAFLKEAEEQFQIYGDLNQVRYQLNKTCTNTIKICTFTIESQKINVRLTPQYDRLFQANNPQVQNHFQQLQEALKVISENARLPLFIYNSQGQERYMKQPQ